MRRYRAQIVLTRLRGILEAVDGPTASVAPTALGGITLAVQLPAYLAAEHQVKLLSEGPYDVEFHTLFTLEGSAQGTNLTPRLIGFATASDRAFFELFTTVKGLGSRRGLRAMARPSSWIAGRIAERDSKALQELPEIGKRLAETVVAELSGKVADFAIDAPSGMVSPMPTATLTGSAAEAVSALVALGQSRSEAERLVERASLSLGTETEAQALIAAALSGS
ncbi:MAG: Holliday junction branch migration protein RuvA [Planctomycetota bacterium]